MNVKLATSLAVMAAFAVTEASAAPASRAYVQRGLVAQYDGIDNAGTGLHDSSATTWKNLTGDTALDGTCASQLSWNGSNGWSVSGDCKPVTVGNELAAAMSAGSFSIQFAVKPTMDNKRECFFGQYKEKDGISIEHNAGNDKTGILRWFRNSGDLNSGSAYKHFNNVKILAGQFASASTVFNNSTGSQTFRVIGDGGDVSQSSTSPALGTLSTSCESVIGGEVQRTGRTSTTDYTSGYGITFQGTYYAFRLYSVALTADEIAWNAKLDAVRFNGADAVETLGAGYSYAAATDTLTATLSATAGVGGAVAVNGGASGASTSVSFDCDGTGANATFTAVPDREHGYVFDRWSGDTSAITEGSLLTPEITVSSDGPVALVANFRLNGDALDGLKFNISFTGDKTADGITFSPTDSDTKQSYETANVPLPALPTVTNSATSCVYLPQPITETNTVFRQDARKSNVAVTGEVATVFCRFRWDGSVLPSEVNYPAIIMNGYTSWNAHPNEGFCLRMRAEKNATRGYFSFVFPTNVIAYNHAGITTTGPAYINQGRWVDVFASVYPSPTDPTLSNADVWYCEVPSWNSSGYFNRSEIGHKHFDDRCAIARMNTKTQKTVIFGSEPNAATYAITSGNGVKCFRGAIACAKGWDRILTTNEMWTVMADLGGVQSFTDLETVAGRTYTTDFLDTDYFREGRNGTATSFLGGGDPAAHRWRALSTTYKSNTLLWDAPKDTDPMPVIYSTKIANVSSGKTQPIHLEVNGTKVWPADAVSKEVAKGEEIKVEIGAEYTYPGLNELKWVYDTAETSNWMIFDHHRLKLVTPPKAFVLIVR